MIRIVQAVVLVFVLAAPTLAEAMHYRYRTSFLSWSRDARQIAFVQSTQGPEGGGAYSLLLVTLAKKSVERFTFTNAVSNGAQVSETVTPEQCAAAGAQAVAAMRGFDGFALDASWCTTRGEQSLLTASPAGERAVWLASKIRRLALHGFELVCSKNGTASAIAGKTIVPLLEPFTRDEPYFELIRSKDDAIVVVTAGGAEQEPTVLYHSADGHLLGLDPGWSF